MGSPQVDAYKAQAPVSELADRVQKAVEAGDFGDLTDKARCATIKAKLTEIVHLMNAALEYGILTEFSLPIGIDGKFTIVACFSKKTVIEVE